VPMPLPCEERLSSALIQTKIFKRVFRDVFEGEI